MSLHCRFHGLALGDYLVILLSHAKTSKQYLFLLQMPLIPYGIPGCLAQVSGLLHHILNISALVLSQNASFSCHLIYELKQYFQERLSQSKRLTRNCAPFFSKGGRDVIICLLFERRFLNLSKTTRPLKFSQCGRP